MTNKIRVLIADDHTIVRSGVRLLLESEPDIEVVGEALNGREVLELATELQPQVILMDIAMPEIDGLEATHLIKERWPQIEILVLTMHRSEEYFFEMLRKGASGYVLKAADTEDLVKAVRIVAKGEVFLYPTLANRLVKDYLGRFEVGVETDSQLTAREREVLQLAVEGYSNKEIAEKLVISLSTIHTHKRNLMNKLGINNQRGLIQYARKHGLNRDTYQ